MFEDSRLTNQLRKADYQREFYPLIKALEESIDPAPDAASLEDLNYDPENGGIKDGTVKYVIGYGLFRLDVTSTLPVDNVNVLGTGYAEGRWLILEGGGNASDSSDALNTPSHKAVDSLVHDIAETCYEEVTRDGSNRVTDVIVWTNPGKTVKIREVNVTRTSGRVSQIVRKQYDAGGTLIATVTSVIARSGGRVSDITHTET